MLFLCIVKKITSIVFLLIYLSALTGWSANIHFCGDEVSSVSLFSQHSDLDCCCNKMKCDCCTDHRVETKIHKAHENQSKVTVDFKLRSTDVTTLAFKSLDLSSESNPAFLTQINHIPPLISKQPVYLRNLVFRI